MAGNAFSIVFAVFVYLFSRRVRFFAVFAVSVYMLSWRVRLFVVYAVVAYLVGYQACEISWIVRMTLNSDSDSEF